MIVGCYSVDLYCENTETGTCKTGGRHCFPGTYTGETQGECFRDARCDGWRITRDRKAFCPKCSGKRPPKR